VERISGERRIQRQFERGFSALSYFKYSIYILHTDLAYLSDARFYEPRERERERERFSSARTGRVTRTCLVAEPLAEDKEVFDAV